MLQLRTLFGDIWRYLPLAGLANEYHPCTEGGVIPVPFIQAQKTIIQSMSVKNRDKHALEPPKLSFAVYLRQHSSIPVRDRALVCLRSAHLCKTRHLMPQVAAMALDHGVLASDIQLISSGRLAPGWSRWDHTLICTVDDIFKHQAISAKLWRILIKKYTVSQILDLILCSASFHLCI